MPRTSDADIFLRELLALSGKAGNYALMSQLGWSEARYWNAHEHLLTEGRIQKGRGQGGSVSAVGERKPKPSTPRGRFSCSFCEKNQDQLKKLVAGPNVLICDECVDLCAVIMTDHAGGFDRDMFPQLFASLNTSADYNDILMSLSSDALYSIKGLKVKEHTCFYLGPFVEPFNTIYSDHIKPTVERARFTINRADEIFGSRPIMQDIWDGIFCSEIIVADVTGKNPNVMYEIGLAHTMGKPVIMLTQDIADVPFDLRHYRCVVYSHTPRGCNELVERLEATVRAVEKIKYRFSFSV